MERKACGCKFDTDQSYVTFSDLLNFQFPKAKNWGRCSSPEEVRIAIVCAVSVSAPLVSHTLLVYSSLPPLRISKRMALLKINSDSERVGEETFSTRYNFLRNWFKTSTDDPFLVTTDNHARHVVPKLLFIAKIMG